MAIIYCFKCKAQKCVCSKNILDVHAQNCCIRCGCKYGKDIQDHNGSVECTVVAGIKEQANFCSGKCWMIWGPLEP